MRSFRVFGGNAPHGWAVLALTGFGLALRLTALDISFWYDEGLTGYLSRLGVGEIVHFLSQEEIHPPLYFLLIRVWAAAFPTDLGIRCFSVLAGVLTLPLVYSLCAKLFDRRVAAVGTAFLALSWFNVYYSQEARQYSFYILLTVVALWFLVAAVGSRRIWNRWWLGYLATLPLITYTHGIGPLIVLGLGVCHLCLVWPLSRPRLLQWIVSYLPAALLYLPWLPSQLAQAREAGSYYTWLPPVSIASILRTMEMYLYFPPFGLTRFLVKALWLAPQVGLLVLAVVTAPRALRARVLALLALLVVPIAAISIYGWLFDNIFVTRSLAPLVVPIVILMALPVRYFTGRWRHLISAGIAVALLFAFVSTVFYLVHRDEGAQWRESVSLIARSIEPGDSVVVLPRGARHVFEFYFQETDAARPVTPLTDLEEVEASAARFEPTDGRLWIVRDRVVSARKTEQIVNWFRERSDFAEETELRGVEVILAVPTAGNLPPG